MSINLQKVKDEKDIFYAMLLVETLRKYLEKKTNFLEKEIR